MNIHINKSYEHEQIIHNLKLDICDHKINVILGPSGCGKTTILNAVAGLTTYEGKIDTPINVSYVFQEDRLFPHFTVYKNLKIINPNESLIDTLLTKFEIKQLEHKYPNHISGGEKQRVSIIRAFLNKSDVILMDEPFKSLDFDLKQKLIKEVLQVQKETRKTILLVTHDLDVAMYLGERIHVLSKKVTRKLNTYENKYQGLELNEDSISLRNEIKNQLIKGA